jgi:hypothetical protein
VDPVLTQNLGGGTLRLTELSRSLGVHQGERLLDRLGVRRVEAPRVGRIPRLAGGMGPRDGLDDSPVVGLLHPFGEPFLPFPFLGPFGEFHRSEDRSLFGVEWGVPAEPGELAADLGSFDGLVGGCPGFGTHGADCAERARNADLR